MSAWAGWVNPETMRLMGLALLHFLWQGAALGAAAFLAMSLARRATVRYVLGISLLAAMVAAPAITFLVLTHRHTTGEVTWQHVAALSGTPARLEAASISETTQRVLSLGSPISSRTSSIYLLWFVEAWFLGVVLLSLRPAAGFLLIERMRLKCGTPISGALYARCLELQRRIGLYRVVRYCESLQLEAPAVVGWFRPVILLPVSALTGLSTDQLSTVIAHELAHVKRYDAFVNVFQMAAETLLFYHPAIWWLSKRIREERELCCDDVAIAVCGNAVEYARALAAMAEWQTAPALVMAANRSPLAERVARLLGAGKMRGGLRGAGIAGSALCLCASILAGNALLHAAQRSNDEKRESQAALLVQPALVAVESPSGVVGTRPVVAGDESGATEIRPDGLLSAPVIDPHRMFFPPRNPTPYKEKLEAQKGGELEQSQSEPRDNSEKQERSDKGGSYIEGLKAAGLTDLSVDQLISMKIQGVTPEYVWRIHELGLKPGVDELIAMKIQGVTPELIRSMRNSGLATEIGEIIALRVQGVTPEYVKQLHDAGLEADTGKILAMKIQGISPEYIREMRAVTDAKLPADELIGMKIQGVTPEYVREMKALGLQMNSGELIGLKVQGVTPEYVKAMQAAGLKMNAREVTGAKVQGLTPEFVSRARQHGFQNLDLHKLLALKNSGVLDE
jgi:beta-lactamase regulating signal transducer with metallopeptidase domain